MTKIPTPDWSLTHIDLLSERYGGQALSCNDEFFANASNLTKRSEPIFIDDKYTDRGKWMDGWETRRSRNPTFDWCILKLGLPGKICAFDVDTTFFRGNAPQKVSIEACVSTSEPDANTTWITILDISEVAPHSHNPFTPLQNPTQDDRHWTHLRLNIFPDGGVARLRVYGEPKVDWSKLLPNELVDLAASTNGGRALACSDMFFSPMNNLIAPGRGVNMGDGWETKRRRGPGHDWLILKLASPGTIKRVLLDTCHFKGNFPESFMLEAATSDEAEPKLESLNWTTLVERTKLTAHNEHIFQDTVLHQETVFTHARLNIYPDGGVSRLRLFGYPKNQ